MSEEDKEKMEYLFEIVGTSMNLTKREILEVTRRRQNVLARKVICYFAKEDTKIPLREVGSIIGKDHSTVVHYCKFIKNTRNQSPYLDAIMKSVESGYIHPALKLRAELTALVKYNSSEENRVNDIFDFLFRNLNKFDERVNSYHSNSFQDYAIQSLKDQVVEMTQSMSNMKDIITDILEPKIKK